MSVCGLRQLRSWALATHQFRHALHAPVLILLRALSAQTGVGASAIDGALHCRIIMTEADGLAVWLPLVPEVHVLATTSSENVYIGGQRVHIAIKMSLLVYGRKVVKELQSCFASAPAATRAFLSVFGVIFSLRQRETIATGGIARSERGAPAIAVSFASDGDASAFVAAVCRSRLATAAPLSSADFNRRLIRVEVSEGVVLDKARLSGAGTTSSAAAGAASTFSDAEHIRLAGAVLEELQLDIPDAHGNAMAATVPLRDLLRDGRARLFPLHDPGALQALRSSWGMLRVPVDAIAGYLGPASGMYFAFLQTLTLALLPSAALGVVLWAASALLGFEGSGSAVAAAYACVNALWATVTLKVWRRREASLAQQWGVFNAEEDEMAEQAAAGEDEEAEAEAEVEAEAQAEAQVQARTHEQQLTVSAAGAQQQAMQGSRLSRSSEVGMRSRAVQQGSSTVTQLSRFACGTLPIMLAALLAALAFLFALERFRVGLERALAAPVPHGMLRSAATFYKHYESPDAAAAAIAQHMASGFASSAQASQHEEQVVQDQLQGPVDTVLAALDGLVAWAVNRLVAPPLSGENAAHALLSQALHHTAGGASFADLMPLRWRLPLQRLPWLLFTISVFLLNNLGGKLAQWLTAREHHSTPSEATDAVAVKRLVLSGVTSFFSIAFVCFWQQDVAQVQQRLLSLFVISLVSNLPELLGPQLLGGAALMRAKAAGTVGHARVDTQDLVAIAAEARSNGSMSAASAAGGGSIVAAATQSGADATPASAAAAPLETLAQASQVRRRRGLQPADKAGASQAQPPASQASAAPARVPIEQRAAGLISPGHLAPVTGLADAVAHMPDHLNRAQLEASLPPYNPYEDTEEVLLLFGFSLFAAAFPLAPAIALLVLGLEMWVDKRKALSVQRPMPTRRASLGVYNTAFSALEMLAIASNVAIAYVLWTQKPSSSAGGIVEGKLDNTAAQPDATAKLHAVLWFVLLEHAIAVVKVLIDKALPDVPEEVRLAARWQRMGTATPRRLGSGSQRASGAKQEPAQAGGVGEEAAEREECAACQNAAAGIASSALHSHVRLAPSQVKPAPVLVPAAVPVRATSVAYARSAGGIPVPESRPLGLQQLLQSLGAVTTAV